MTKGTGPGLTAESFAYDGLDRRDQRTKDGQTRDFSYVGSSESLSQEQGDGATRSYDYDAGMERTGLTQREGRASFKTHGGTSAHALYHLCMRIDSLKPCPTSRSGTFPTRFTGA